MGFKTGFFGRFTFSKRVRKDENYQQVALGLEASVKMLVVDVGGHVGFKQSNSSSTLSKDIDMEATFIGLNNDGQKIKYKSPKGFTEACDNASKQKSGK